MSGVEYRAREVMEKEDLEPLVCNAISDGQAVFLAAEDGQFLLYYEDPKTQVRLYHLRLK